MRHAELRVMAQVSFDIDHIAIVIPSIWHRIQGNFRLQNLIQTTNNNSN